MQAICCSGLETSGPTLGPIHLFCDEWVGVVIEQFKFPPIASERLSSFYTGREAFEISSTIQRAGKQHIWWRKWRIALRGHTLHRRLPLSP